MRLQIRRFQMVGAVHTGSSSFELLFSFKRFCVLQARFSDLQKFFSQISNLLAVILWGLTGTFTRFLAGKQDRSASDDDSAKTERGGIDRL